MVVYPEGVWYSGVTPADVPEIVASHFQDGVVVERLARTDVAALKSEIIGNRDRMLAARRAREASGALPDEWHECIRAFQESRAILTALELNLFTALGEGASAPETAGTLSVDARALELLLNALAALGLLRKTNDIFRNSPVAARFFAETSPDSARPALLHIANLWTRWSNLTECVRVGTAVQHEEIPQRGEDWTHSFIAAMHRNAVERAPVVVRAVGAENIARMLDVGGGSGAYSIAFAQANPKLRADILDLATVAPIAQGHIDRAGVAGRVHVRTGDLRSDWLGEDYDLVFISAICHMLSEEENRDLLRRSREALAPGGSIAIQDFILEPDKTAPKFGALFALNMLVGTRAGSSYSGPEYMEWLSEAGFREIRHVRMPGPVSLMLARRPQ
jgi:2-polyprenyl-3-methyl-5-hydroxy-6-metoxy-1,4-benzoquinol methylase